MALVVRAAGLVASGVYWRVVLSNRSRMVSWLPYLPKSLTFTSTSTLTYHDPSMPIPSDTAPNAPLLRIQEVAADVGLTTRSIRYYEEIGLLEPAARSDGAYRLFDSSDLERLRFIKSLRDDAGFSLAQISQLLEDETARERNRERFRATQDPDERRAILDDARARVDRQIATLEAKAARRRRDDRRGPRPPRPPRPASRRARRRSRPHPERRR